METNSWNGEGTHSDVDANADPSWQKVVTSTCQVDKEVLTQSRVVSLTNGRSGCPCSCKQGSAAKQTKAPQSPSLSLSFMRASRALKFFQIPSLPHENTLSCASNAAHENQHAVRLAKIFRPIHDRVDPAILAFHALLHNPMLCYFMQLPGER